MSDEEPPKPEERGIPAWVMTFADLMTLLMCFFVLLLSFSEMDAAKFKELSGSMKDAFGVQTEVKARTIPKGTSVIAREFSPGKPEPTSINSVRQFTIDTSKNTLDAVSRERRDKKDTAEQARRLRLALQKEIRNGDIAVETEGMKVVIRILEKASFDSGDSEVKGPFVPVLRNIARLLDDNNGSIVVSGHTDDIPISNERFRSNWELSTSRAVSVAHVLLSASNIADDRFVVTGHAATRPIAENDSAENRAKNRRVDISISRGQDKEKEQKKGIEQELMSSRATEETMR